MVEFFIAKKHILERKKQSLISIIGILIGVTVLIVSIGVSNGLDKNMINSILSLTSHVKIEAGENIKDYEKISEKISEISKVKGALAKVESQGILKYKGEFASYVAGVKITSYDLEKAKKVLDLDKKIVAGKINFENKKNILIGKELSLISGMKVGDTVKLVTAENVEIDLEISGIFQTGFYDYDVNMVIVPLFTSQYINYMGESVNRISVRLKDPYDAAKLKNKISEVLVENFPDKLLFLTTWGEQNKALLSALTLEKSIMIIVFSLIVIVAGFLIWLTLNMLVREKTKDIGILRAMGYSKKNILNIFFIQGLILGGIGILIGVFLSIIILWYIKNYALDFVRNIYYINTIPIEISFKEIMKVVFANILIILLSSIFPAYRAAKMENVEALRYE